MSSSPDKPLSTPAPAPEAASATSATAPAPAPAGVPSIDYSRFDKLALQVDEEEREEREQIEAKRAAEKAKRAALATNNDGLPIANVVPEPNVPRIKTATEVDEDDDDDSDDDELKLHPLFWTKVPEGEHSEAVQKVFSDMIYEDKTPEELAVQFKDNGNMSFQGKYYKEALGHYEEALQWARKAESDTIENRTTYAAILSNRAAINLKRKNYGSVKSDCRAAIKFGPSPLPNCKAHFRGAQACVQLQQWRQALTFVKQGLVIEPENSAMLKLQRTVTDKLTKDKRISERREREEMTERRMDDKMRKACQLRGVKVGPLAMDLARYAGEDAAAKRRGGAPRAVIGQQDDMTWPVLFLYPEHTQTDFVSSMHEGTTLREQLELMFPASIASSPRESFAPWDDNRAYAIDNMEVFFQEEAVRSFDMAKPWAAQYLSAVAREVEYENYKKRPWVRVPMDLCLLQVLQHPNYVVAGLPSFHIVARSSPFYTTFVKQCKDDEGVTDFADSVNMVIN